MNKESNENDDKKIDNGLKKKEIEEKYGAQFFENSKMPLDIETDWLNYIETFEEQFSNAKTTSVYNYLDKPSYIKLSDLNPKEISAELDRILKLMQNGGISLDTLCEVEEKELYRFITEELFKHEMDDMKVDGMMCCFTYEEFHPNAKLDVEDAIDYFFRFTMAKMENIGGEGYDLLYIDTENYENANGEKLEKQKVTTSINNFLKSFDSFEFIKNETYDILIDDEKKEAQVNIEIEYKAFYNKRIEWMDFKGNARFKLHPSEYGGWNIYHIDFPGLML